MLVGLQGSGKTTAAGKLACYLRARGERVMLVAGDPYRPAAAEQLRTLGQQVDVPVFFESNVKPPELAKHAFEKARNGGYSVVIMDTAGRSQLDDTLMNRTTSHCSKRSSLRDSAGCGCHDWTGGLACG